MTKPVMQSTGANTKTMLNGQWLKRPLTMQEFINVTIIKHEELQKEEYEQYKAQLIAEKNK